jgi:hypothetical protein
MATSAGLGDARILKPPDGPGIGLVQWLARKLAGVEGPTAFVTSGGNAAQALGRLGNGADAVVGRWPAVDGARRAGLAELIATPRTLGVLAVRAGVDVASPGGVADAFLDGFAPWCIAVLVAADGGRVDVVGEGPDVESARVTPKGRAWLVQWALGRVEPGRLSRDEIERALRGLGA